MADAPVYIEDEAEDREAGPGEVKVEALTNKYRCVPCDEEWEDQWCCACDDECPSCRKDYSPVASEVDATFILKINKTVCPCCDSTHAF